MSANTVAAAAAVVSSAAAIFSVYTGHQSLRRADADRRERSRPAVIALLRRIPEARTGFLMFVLSNVGQTMAREVTVTFDPPLVPDPSSSAGDNSAASVLLRLFAVPIATMAPGAEFDCVYYWHDFAGSGGNIEDVPDQLNVKIAYDSSDGEHYEESYALDVEPFLAHTYVESSDSLPGRIKTINESLKKVADAVTKIESQLRR
jgi:hypothetical protein